MRDKGERGGRGELRKGLILLAVGLWFLANTLEVGGLDYESSWPLLLILIGVAMTAAPRAGRRACCSAQGPVLILWGALAWIATHHVWGLSWTSVWPLALVAIGVGIVWRAVAEQLDLGRSRDGVEP
jgi:ABC-type Fe3+-siderophore transport system permease subunit